MCMQSAVVALNTLQSNAGVLKMLSEKKLANQDSLPEMRDYLKRIGYTVWG